MPCGQLKFLKLKDATITLAEPVTAAPFLNPAAPRAANSAAQMLPAHCRVAATLKPSADSDIKIEVWLPARPAWNGKFQAVGGGGWAGVISYGALAVALQEGYATSSTDTGHESSNPSFAVRHPEKVVDFSHRAIHEMTVKAKAIISAHYGRGPRFSYWTGCSTGGRQGLMEAQRYPEDFDGIIAGAPAINYTHLCAWRLALEASVLKEPARAVPSAKLTLLNHAVLAACDALDGVEDGLLTDPRQCHFDPSTLLCRAGESDQCLTPPQLEAVKMAYAPARKGNGELIYPGLVPGSLRQRQQERGGALSRASIQTSASSYVSLIRVMLSPRAVSRRMNSARENFMATSRFSRVSRPFQTSPIPIFLMGETSPYGPRRCPVAGAGVDMGFDQL
jgi:feruloyl esterase